MAEGLKNTDFIGEISKYMKENTMVLIQIIHNMNKMAGYLWDSSPNLELNWKLNMALYGKRLALIIYYYIYPNGIVLKVIKHVLLYYKQ